MSDRQQIELWADAVHSAIHCDCGAEQHRTEAEDALRKILVNIKSVEPGIGTAHREAEAEGQYTLSIGKASKGIYWARVDSATHYSTATADDPWTAALNAVHEAQFLIVDDESHD